jgi:hypothetical protein
MKLILELLMTFSKTIAELAVAIGRACNAGLGDDGGCGV